MYEYDQYPVTIHFQVMNNLKIIECNSYVGFLGDIFFFLKIISTFAFKQVRLKF